MNPLVKLVTKRAAGRVRVDLASYHDESLLEVLNRLGLGCEQFPDPQLREVHRSEARSILVSLLRLDMAYHAEIMALNEAESLADDFLGIFSAENARFVTNLGKPDKPDRPFDVASSPMTESTFDAGVVCIARSIVGCIWVEDED
jgi:hypothetical protein